MHRACFELIRPAQARHSAALRSWVLRVRSAEREPRSNSLARAVDWLVAAVEQERHVRHDEVAVQFEDELARVLGTKLPGRLSVADELYQQVGPAVLELC